MSYTALAIVGVLVSLGVDLLLLRTKLLCRRDFWTAYAIVLFFQLIVNGILTGRRVVTYDPSGVVGGRTPHFVGDGRFVYAPVEDLLFGFALVVQTLAWWVWWGRRRPFRARTGTPRGESTSPEQDRVARPRVGADETP